ncbi:alpha/beta hydrolase family protein [Planctomicrobium sp. SH668]|uniref:alpha/beta hydrolase family protein n=1 Tax=Planctomicrobium sp. SH668 TaxID=3448126 RepID=UPI003F5AF8E9
MQNQPKPIRCKHPVSNPHPDDCSSLSRRRFLSGLGAATTLAFVEQSASSATKDSNRSAPSFRLEAKANVTATRLDEEVKNAFPLFNKVSVLPDFDLKSQGGKRDVTLHRIVTTTTIPETNETVDVTGLLAIPSDAVGDLPVVSWQHGTILSFDQVPSNLTKLASPTYSLSDDEDSLETLFNIHRFASHGYAVIAADYLGKGPLRNGRGEAYVVKDASTQTCIDMLNAGLEAIRSLDLNPTKLFLNGWSQGAINTQWLHQALRTSGVEIAATAVHSPFNDPGEAWRFWSGRVTFPLPEGVERYPDSPMWLPLCMMVVLGSYEQYYKLDGLIEAVVKPQFHDMTRRYLAKYDLNDIDLSALPGSSDFLVEGFTERFTDQRNSAFLRQLSTNAASYWNYDREIRFHYGLVDEAIHPEMVGRALSAGGKFTTGVPVANANHRTTFLAGLYGDPSTLSGHENVLEWFTAKI